MPSLYLSSSSVQMIVAPSLRVAVKVTNYQEPAVRNIDGLKAQMSVIWTVVVDKLEFCSLYFYCDLNVFGGLYLSHSLTSVDAISNEDEHPSFGSICEALVTHNLERF